MREATFLKDMVASLTINSENMTWDDLSRDVVIKSRIEVLDGIEVSY